MSRSAALRRWIGEHPVVALVVWFFTVGQALAFTPVVGSSAGHELPVEPFTTASTWLGLLLPAVYVTWAADGRPGVHRLVGTLRPAGAGWFLGVLIAVPAVSLAIAVAINGWPSTGAGQVLQAYAAAGPAALVHLLTNNLWEEVAWMGVVQLRLQQRTTPSRAVLVTAPLVALQHVALVADNSLLASLLVTAVLVLVSLPYRAAMAWLYNRTHSLLLVGVAHAVGDAMATGSLLGDAFLPSLYGRNLGPLHLFAIGLLGVVVWISSRGRLGQTS